MLVVLLFLLLFLLLLLILLFLLLLHAVPAAGAGARVVVVDVRLVFLLCVVLVVLELVVSVFLIGDFITVVGFLLCYCSLYQCRAGYCCYQSCSAQAPIASVLLQSIGSDWQPPPAILKMLADSYNKYIVDIVVAVVNGYVTITFFVDNFCFQ